MLSKMVRVGRCDKQNVSLIMATFGFVCVLGMVVLPHLTIGRNKNTEYSGALDIQDQEPTANHHLEADKKTPSTPQWTEIFSFVPLGTSHCDDLFADADKDHPYPPHFQKAMDQLNKRFQSIKDEYNLTRSEGYSHRYTEEGMLYWELASRSSSFVRTICETGFNAGHSSLNWLMANPKATLYSFDVGNHEYSGPLAEYLQEEFPGRFYITWGNSLKSLPEFRKQNPDVKCDLIIIDGGHIYDVAYSDWTNFWAMAGKNSIVLLDNYPSHLDHKFSINLGPVWEEAKQHGEIIEIFRCSFMPPHSRQGFTFGRVNN